MHQEDAAQPPGLSGADTQFNDWTLARAQSASVCARTRRCGSWNASIGCVSKSSRVRPCGGHVGGGKLRVVKDPCDEEGQGGADAGAGSETAVRS
eukprot:5779221-Prymnesium_polylepis.2